MSLNESVVIASALRTPLGGFQGSLSSFTAHELGSHVVSKLINQSKISPQLVEELLFGCVIPAGLGQSPARQVALGADLPQDVSTTTVNKVCGSGMKAVMMAYDQIKSGNNNVIVAGGMESMSNAPYLLPKARSGYRLGHKEALDHLFLDGLQDAGSGKLMGVIAQQTADHMNVSRKEMDEFALESLKRAKEAISTGRFESEIAPIPVLNNVVDTDQQPGLANPEKIPHLKPAFGKDGTITAANSSSISDGASALLVAKLSSAESNGMKPLAKIVAHSSHAQAPEEFCTAPIGAINKVIDRAGWSIDDVDLFEINEAFALVPIAAMLELNIPHEKLNVNGGACALGHPLGASGARIIVTLIHAMKKRGAKRGIASLCIGGGEATAIAIEDMD